MRSLRAVHVRQGPVEPSRAETIGRSLVCARVSYSTVHMCDGTDGRWDVTARDGTGRGAAAFRSAPHVVQVLQSHLMAGRPRHATRWAPRELRRAAPRRALCISLALAPNETLSSPFLFSSFRANDLSFTLRCAFCTLRNRTVCPLHCYSVRLTAARLSRSSTLCA